MPGFFTRSAFFDLGILGLLAWLISFACTGTTDPIDALPALEATENLIVEEEQTVQEVNLEPSEDSNQADAHEHANVSAVAVSGGPGTFSLSVTIKSPDTGCDSYADWWEVVSTSGELIYRRVLLHSHANEQPFTRSGGPVGVELGDEIIVRAHMNTQGYGGSAMRGTPELGFSQFTPEPGFASDLEQVGPLPDGCAF